MAQAKSRKRPWNKGKKLHNWKEVHAHRRRVNPRRRRTAVRANPVPATTVLLANPRRSRRRRAVARVHHKRRAAIHARTNPTRVRRRRHPLKGIRRRHLKRRGNPISAKWSGILTAVKIGIWGGAGVVFARLVGSNYSKYVASHVIGAETDQNGWRHIGNEVLRIVVMGAGTIAAERLILRRVLAPETARAFLYGGLAETGRQAIGTTTKYLSPTTNRATYGLDGPGLDDEVEWVLQGDRYVPYVRGGGMQGLEEASAFEGLEEAEAFEGVSSGW